MSQPTHPEPGRLRYVANDLDFTLFVEAIEKVARLMGTPEWQRFAASHPPKLAIDGREYSRRQRARQGRRR